MILDPFAIIDETPPRKETTNIYPKINIIAASIEGESITDPCLPQIKSRLKNIQSLFNYKITPN